MSNYWEYLGKGLNSFMGSNKDAVKINQNGIFMVINDAESYSYNSIIIDTNNVTAQESLILKYLDVPLFLYVSSKSLNAFNLWYRNAGLVSKGKTTVLRKIGKLNLPPSSAKIDLDIRLMQSESDFQDMKLLESKDKEKPMNMSKIFNRSFLENKNIKTFIAYYNNIPIAKMSTVIDGDVATLWGMKTDSQYEKLGAMILLGEHIINYNIDNFKVKEHYTIPFAMPVYQSSINRGAQAIEEVFLFGSEVNN
jgi:hypothetical protein